MANRPIGVLKSMLQPDARPSSVPIPISRVSRTSSVERPSSIPPALRPHSRPRGSSDPSRVRGAAQEMDLTGLLQQSEPSVVKTRIGSVLSRGFILKTDHYPSGPFHCTAYHPILIPQLTGRALDLDLNVHGAPNFRAPRVGDFNVFGAAQPRTQGLRAILSILRCRPGTPNPSHVVWFSTREEPISKSFLVQISPSNKSSVSTYHSTCNCCSRLLKHLSLSSLHLWTSLCASRRI